MAAAKSKRAEKVKEELRKLTLLEDNKYCIDCGMRGPLYAVLDFHIFVCSQCSAIHRGAQHKVKGISMSEFTDEELTGMKIGGNATAKKVWLQGFRGPLPREGDEKAIKDHIRHVFDEKRYYSAQAQGEFKAALAQGTLPPVQPLPAHIGSQLSTNNTHSQAEQPLAPPPQPAHQHPGHHPQAQQVPTQYHPAPGQPAVQPQPQPQPTVVQPTQMPQRPVDVFDTIFQQPPPQQQQYSNRQSTGPMQQQTAPAPTVDFFNDTPSTGASHQQPMNRQPQQAAQMQMHSTQYQPQMANPQAAQAQMSQNFFGAGNAPTSQPAPSGYGQADPNWGAHAAQRQMTSNQQPTNFSYDTPYAAQHQMNTAPVYGSVGGAQGNSMQQQNNNGGGYGNWQGGQPTSYSGQQQYGSSSGANYGAQNAYSAPPQQQQQQPMDFFSQPSSTQHHGQGSTGYGAPPSYGHSNSGGMSEFGPPPIPSQPYSGGGGGGYGYGGSAPPKPQPSPDKPQGPDPFASLDFFHKK
jgi:hypothetical protein